MSRQSEENVIILGEVPSTWVNHPRPDPDLQSDPDPVSLIFNPILNLTFGRVITVAEPYASYLLQIFSYFSLPDFIQQFLDNYPYITNG